MPGKKILKGVKPFNKYFFRSCFYHQLMVAYSEFGVSEEYHLLNYMPFYVLNDKNEVDFKKEPVFSSFELEHLTGVREIRKSCCKDISAEIIRSVDSGSPIIVAVDTFYLNFQPDLYNKKHKPHFIAVYGYDKTNKIFSIIDHEYSGSWKYIEQQTDFSVIAEAYAGHERNFSHEFGGRLIKFKKTGKPQALPTGRFKSAIAESKDDIIYSLMTVNDLCKRINETVSEKGKFNEIQALGSLCFRMKSFKRLQNYQLQMVYNDEKLNALITSTEEQIYYIACILQKMFHAGYDDKRVEKLKKRVSDFMSKEIEIHISLLGLCDIGG